MPSTLVVDTSVLYAAVDRSDRNHERCVNVLASDVATAVPAPVLVETCLLADRLRQPIAVERVLASVVDGTVLVVDLDGEDYARVRSLVIQYDDLPLGMVDASVVAVAERLEQDTIATLDRRHFSVVRPSHVPAFTLVPELS